MLQGEQGWEGQREREDVQVELRDCRQVHKLSGDEKTTEEQLNNATSLHSGILCGVLYSIPGVPEWVASCDAFVSIVFAEGKVCSNVNGE